MRRIIERKVTVVTTTTWTISWQGTPPQPSFEVDLAQPVESCTDDSPVQVTPNPSAVIELKEADLESAKKSTKPKPSSRVVKPYLSKPERK